MQFHAQGQHGSGLFATFFAALPIPTTQRHSATAKFFGVSERTLNRWLSGETEPPRAAVATLWHETYHGRAVLDEHSHRGFLYERAAAQALRDEVATLRRYITQLENDLSDAARPRYGHAGPANSGKFDPGAVTTPAPRYRLP